MSKTSRQAEIAREKIARAQALAEQRRRQRTRIAGIGAAVVIIAAGTAIAVVSASGGGAGHKAASDRRTPGFSLAALSTLGRLAPAPPSGQPGPEGVPIPAAPPLAGMESAATGRTVDGISCETTEKSLSHTHTHLTIVVDGAPRLVPADLGIPGPCMYWVHTHAADGIIHVESPVRRTFTLGQVFDEWGQPLSPDRIGPVTGHVTALYNGKVVRGNPRDIPLRAHAEIQLEIGTPLTTQQTITFPSGL